MAKRMFRTVIQALVVAALLTGTAAAQTMNMLPKERTLTPEELQRQKEIESEYRAAADKIPDRKASKDPWGNVRQSPETPAAVKHKRQ